VLEGQGVEMQEFYKKHTKNTEKPSPELLEQAAREAERREAEILDDHWSELLAECRVAYRIPMLESDRHACRISLGLEFQELLRRRDDVLLTIIKDQAKLYEHGDLCWGQLVEANALLTRPNNEHTLPAAVIYSLDPHYEGNPGPLEKIAQGLSSSKNTVDDDTEFGVFMRTIRKDFERILKLELPRSICDGRSVYYATLLVQPSHLPGGLLTRRRFPIISKRTETEAAMVLPQHFWPQRLIKNWIASPSGD
jgi:hypothetical protein